MPRAKRTTTDAIGRVVPLTRRGFGMLRRLPSGNYQASYIGPDDQRHKAPDTFLTRPDAEAWLARQYEIIKNDEWQQKVEPEPFGEYASNWVETRRRPDGTPLKARTLADYRKSIVALKPLENHFIHDITPPQIRQLHARLTKQSGATSAGRHMRMMRAVLTTAYRDGLITRNPVPSELCRTLTGLKHRPPTPEELAKVLEVIEPKFKLAVCLAAFGGLRIGEWRALRRNDLKLTGGYYIVTIAQQAQLINGKWETTTPKSESGIRKVALPTWLTPEIKAHLATIQKSPNALLFPASKSSDFVDQEWKNAWNAARKKAGIMGEVRGHDLRHYYATSLAQAGASAPLLQSALGHSSIAMSMKYVHAAKGASPELADLIKPPELAKAS